MLSSAGLIQQLIRVALLHVSMHVGPPAISLASVKANIALFMGFISDSLTFRVHLTLTCPVTREVHALILRRPYDEV